MDLLTHYLHSPDAWITFLTLSVLEVVLGIDNVIFLAIVANRLSRLQRAPARLIGLILALFMRVAFLTSVVWLTNMTATVLQLNQFLPEGAPTWLRSVALSWRDLILLAGGLFLIYKALTEIGAEIISGTHQRTVQGVGAFGLVVLQIVLLDLVFSIDSVMTAVGLSRELPIMIAAITFAIIVMLFAAGVVARFIERHPTVKMLALTFLIVVGASLISDSLHHHVPREILYAVIGFSLFVELFKLVAGRRFQDLGERLRHPVTRLVGLGLLIWIGYLVVQNLRYVTHDMVLSIIVVVLAFQVVLEVLNSLARRKRLKASSSGPALP